MIASATVGDCTVKIEEDNTVTVSEAAVGETAARQQSKQFNSEMEAGAILASFLTDPDDEDFQSGLFAVHFPEFAG